jgi:protease II
MKYVSLVVFLFLTYTGFSQITIEGEIKDSENSGIPFASVYLQSSKYGTVSNENGSFELQIKGEAYTQDSLIVSFIGYETAKIPVNLRKSSTLHIRLEPSVILLNEMHVDAKRKKVLTALQIIKKAISNRNDNYINTSYTTEGFYRETIQEDNVAIRINEAAVRFNFSKYPQKHFHQAGFKKFMDSYNEYYGVLHKSWGFPHLAQLYGYYNSTQDAAKILSSRYSTQYGKIKESVNPVGGPLDLTGNDKLKFQYDFFDRHRFSDYAYKKGGIIQFKGEWCYVIRFNPKKEKKAGSLHHDWSKKMEHAIYTGQAIVSMTDFSVYQISCEMLPLMNHWTLTQSWTGKYPVSMKLQLDYGNSPNGLMLVHAKNTQVFLDKTKTGSSQFEVERALWISDSILNTRVEEYTYAERLDLTRVTNIEDFTEAYDEQFWESYQRNPLYHPLSQKTKQDLEWKIPLEKQFKSQFIPIDSIPVPTCEPKQEFLVLHGDSLEDNYRWLETKSEQTLNYIEAENAYYKRVQNQIKKHKREFVMSHNFILKKDTLKSSQTDLFNGHQLIRKTIDDSTRIFELMGDSSTKELFNYGVVVAPNIMWDSEFSPHLSFIAYSFNKDHGLTNTTVLKNIDANTTDTLFSTIELAWLNDSILVYSTTNLPGRYPANQVYWYNGHTLQDSLIYEEHDHSREVEIKKSATGELVFISSTTKDETDPYLLDQALAFRQIEAPIPHVTFEANQFANTKLLCLLDYNKLYEIPVKPGQGSSSKLIHKFKKSQAIFGFSETENYYVATVYEEGKMQLYSINKKNNKTTQIPFDETFYSLTELDADYAADECKLTYQSTFTPYTEYSIDLTTNEKSVVVPPSQLNWFTKPEYFELAQTFAKASDGTKIPITYLNRKFIKKKKGTILKVYGSYGAMHPRGFSEIDLALANLGFIVAYAHVRGGMEKGKAWYLDGKNLTKRNSITDYITCAEHLIAEELATDSTLVGYGLSAGGIVLGAAINEAPELFNTVILDRPCVDLLNTQSNDTLPLTTIHYSEVGNPTDSIDYKYILSYCPYQNITPNNYPNILYLSGINDNNVHYWNPLKHLAAIRENNLSDTKQIIHISEGGHIIPWSKGTSDWADIYALVFYNLVEIKQ